MTPSDIARQYASDVVGGGIVACRYVKFACQRFLNDLDRQGDDDWPYVFDEAKADRAVKFMQLMPHTKGKWSASKSKLVFEPWQVFIEANIFGWVKKDTGKRRFREAYEEIPRKNGKSARLAARGIYLFAADGESGAEVYSGATTEKQAFEVFRPAWMMAHKLENLRNRFGIELSGNQKNPGPMFVMEDMSKFETVIGNPGDGASPMRLWWTSTTNTTQTPWWIPCRQAWGRGSSHCCRLLRRRGRISAAHATRSAGT